MTGFESPEIEQFLEERGAGQLPRPGGTLPEHLVPFAARAGGLSCRRTGGPASSGSKAARVRPRGFYSLDGGIPVAALLEE